MTHTIVQHNKEMACRNLFLWNESRVSINMVPRCTTKSAWAEQVGFAPGLNWLRFKLRSATVQAWGETKNKTMQLGQRGLHTRGMKGIATRQRGIRNDCGLVKQTQWRTAVTTRLRVVRHKTIQCTPLVTMKAKEGENAEVQQLLWNDTSKS